MKAYKHMMESLGDWFLGQADKLGDRNQYGRTYRALFLIGDWFLNRSL